MAVGLMGSLGLLGLLLSKVDLDQVTVLVLRLKTEWVVGGFVLYLVLQGTRALRYRVLVPSASPRVLLGVHLVHVLLLRVMPFRTGELGFAWLMRRHGAGGLTHHLVGVALLRVLDFAMVLSLLGLSLGAFSATSATHLRSTLTAPLALGALASLAPVYVRPLMRAAHAALECTLHVTRLGRITRIQNLRGALRESVEWSSSLPLATIWKLSGLTAIQWGVNFALIRMLLAAMRIETDWTQTVLGGGVVVLGGLVPLAGVGNLGPLEASWTVGFGAVGVPEGLAITSAFGFSAISFAYATLAAVAGWLVLPRPSC